VGYKDVCLNCRKAFNRGTDFNNPQKLKCSDCENETIAVNQKFKPPKKSEIKKWEVVKYLIENGFDYSSVYSEREKGHFQTIGKLPENMRAAKELVNKIKQKK